jgi:hypothetical protein
MESGMSDEMGSVGLQASPVSPSPSLANEPATPFTIDTSGRVACTDPTKPCICHAATWDRLDAFTQGYVEALFAELDQARLAAYRAAPWGSRGREVPVRAAFSWLAPETLARIMEDCGRALRDRRSGYYAESAVAGKQFWAARQEAFRSWGHAFAYQFRNDFPPLTLYLGDDGKVRLAQAEGAPQ